MKGKKERKIRLLLTGGGTGGHLFPAIATAQKFQQEGEVEVLFVGTRRKLDADSLSRYGFTAETITSSGIKGKSPLQLLKALCALPVGYLQALSILRKFSPDIVFAVGGYVTGPVVMAAAKLKIPVVLHEQNSIPGLANRKLAPFARRVCFSLPGAENFFAKEKTVFTGNPVRDAILQLAAKKEQKGDDKKTVLVLGGSQGAHALNVLVPQAISHISVRYAMDTAQELTVIHQCGSRDVAAVRKAYAEISGKNGAINAEVEPFFADMAAVYSRADVVISRAGATTLAELAVLGKPAVLIPYPYAADDHQTKNGQYYVDGGGALMFAEAALDVRLLGECVGGLLTDTASRQKMSAAMKKLAVSDAAERIMAVCQQVLGGDSGGCNV